MSSDCFGPDADIVTLSSKSKSSLRAFTFLSKSEEFWELSRVRWETTSEVKSYHFEDVEYKDNYVTKCFDHAYPAVSILYKEAQQNSSFKVSHDEPDIAYYRDGNIGDCLVSLMNLDADFICTFETNKGEVAGISREQVAMIAVHHTVHAS